MVEQACLWAAAVAAAVAAYCWFMVSRVAVPAPPNTAGVGAPMGGYLISMAKGVRIDLHATLDKQSDWNAQGAAAAGISAALTAVALLVKALGLA